MLDQTPEQAAFVITQEILDVYNKVLNTAASDFSVVEGLSDFVVGIIQSQREQAVKEALSHSFAFSAPEVCDA
jgi:hypothetical protein